MNRLSQCLTSLGNRKLLVPFFTAGYPDQATSLEYVRAAVDCGADIVEIGMPFSDPLADGPQIQFSSHIALCKGITLTQILRGVSKLRSRISVPIVLMGYYNPVLAYGESKFLTDAQNAGVDGLIIPDLPVDEASGYCRSMNQHDLSAIFLVAPTSSHKRIRKIDRMSTDFVYAVTVTGVTGMQSAFTNDTDRYLQQLKAVLKKPFVAGFGVSSPETARRMCRHANGVVIGSALVQQIRSARSRRDSIKEITQWLQNIRKAI